MKKLLLLIILIAIFFQNGKGLTAQRTNRDSIGNQHNPQKKSAAIKFIKNKPITNKKEIIRTVDASQIPFILQEDLIKEGQCLRLRITNYTQPHFKVKLFTKKGKGFNVRINMVTLCDGSSEGPLPNEFSCDVKCKGDILVHTSWSNMAEGKRTGRFFIKVE